MRGDNIIQVLGVKKTFDKKKTVALDDISFVLKKGGMAALVGPDGAGKTTFLRLLCGLLIPDFGNILIDGFSPVDDLAQVKDIIGYMPQKFGLYEDLTVIENLRLYSVLNKGDRELADIDMLLEFAGLSNFKKRLAGDLSGGMKQKLGLCCTLISKPKLLLLDEPSVGVDPLSRRELMKIVEKLVYDNGISVIWSTAYLDEAQKFERVFILSEGKKIYDGSPSKVSNNGNETGAFEDFVIRKIKENKEDTGGEDGLKLLPVRDLDVKIPQDGVTIRAVGLTKKYGNFTAANDISFDIKKGEIFGLLGPNGAGKSTTFKMLCGLIRPNSGHCSIMGVNINENPTLARSYLGYMAQKFSLFGDLSVRQNLNFFAGVYGLFGAKKDDEINMLLEYFDLKRYEDFDAKTLPLGYKQRLALSCAIVHRPPVLFLDEPTSGVDPLTRREFWEQINFLSKGVLNGDTGKFSGGGTTILVTTHFMDEAQYCNRISLIYKGKSLITAPPETLKNLVKSDKNPNPTMEDAFIELICCEDAALSNAGAEEKGINEA